ncbi:MAG TPA: PilZ domain-containing protein [Candidatus Acidoferrales bacterium]|nr:PilZ domain-containing protein [Candidatus Acidoferrales bacterium]
MEHRREPRHPFFATVELLETESEVKVQARTGDLSLHGCYVDTMNPFPAGSKVRVTITHERADFKALGSVAHSQPNVGMGISFTEVEPEQRKILFQWLSGVHGD